MIHIVLGASFHFGNSTLPTYLLKVFALPYLIILATNRRNSTLLQSILQDILAITSDCGVIVYVPVRGHNLATENSTLMHQASLNERNLQDGSGNMARKFSNRLASTSTGSSVMSREA